MIKKEIVLRVVISTQ